MARAVQTPRYTRIPAGSAPKTVPRNELKAHDFIRTEI
jgi:hypothetical protein